MGLGFKPYFCRPKIHDYFFDFVWCRYRIELFKWGLLTAERSNRFYATLMGVGFAVGLPAVTLGVIRNFKADWALEYSMFLGWQFNYWGSLFIALGYICAVMLICKQLTKSRWIGLFAGVGRTALTNYLMQTFVCTTIFYGHGLGLFGEVQRTQQVLVVIAVWALQLLGTSIWLRYFRFGPTEWLWRSLTYWKRQPIQK